MGDPAIDGDGDGDDEANDRSVVGGEGGIEASREGVGDEGLLEVG